MGMALQAVDQGGDFNVTEVTPAAFRAMPVAILSGIDLIAINNHPARIDCGSGLGLGTNWHSVVGVLSGGRVVLTSHDAPRFKLLRTPPAPPLFTGLEPFGTIDLVRQSALWAGGLPGTTGLLIFNDAARFPTVGGVGWGNPELNLPVAWGITDSDQSGGTFLPGGYTDILAAFQTHPIYDGTAFGGVVLSDARFAPFSISSFSANIVDASFHSIFANFNALIFMPTEVLINAGNPDPGGFGILGSTVAPGPDGTAITIIRNAVLTVVIDIKPGSDPNGVNPGAKGSIPVAILTTSTFDATVVDDQTLAFGPNGAAIFHAAGHVEDVDGDGDLDLLVHFKTAETGIACGDTDATLAGQTFGGLLIMGTDFIKTAGC